MQGQWQNNGILVGYQADLLLMARLGLLGSRSVLTDMSQLLGTHQYGL